MTEKEIETARYIKDNILPKLQEMQRDLYLDKNILISVGSTNLNGGTSATLWVRGDNRDFFSKILRCVDFQFYTRDSKQKLHSTLRGIQHFVRNWRERLS